MNIVCIAAAGNSLRMGGSKSKQFLHIDQMPVIAHCIHAFNLPEVDKIILAVRNQDLAEAKSILDTHCKNIDVSLTEGGQSRTETIIKMIEYAAQKFKLKDSDVIITHDGARPFVDKDIILENINALNNCDCAGTAIETKDSIYISQDTQRVEGVPYRGTIYLAQTPQSFTLKSWNNLTPLLTNEQIESNFDICSLFHIHNFNVIFVKGNTLNLKITTKDDWIIAKSLNST